MVSMMSGRAWKTSRAWKIFQALARLVGRVNGADVVSVERPEGVTRGHGDSGHVQLRCDVTSAARAPHGRDRLGSVSQPHTLNPITIQIIA